MPDTDSFPTLRVVEHPLIGVRLTRLRDESTGPEEFRRQLHELSQLLLFEVTRELETVATTVRTPLEETAGFRPARPIILVPILRAGLGMLNGIISILPEAQIGHIGMVRNEATHRPESYYRSLPANIGDADVLLIDPMLATGHSGAEAATELVNAGAQRVRFITLVACPEGIRHFSACHPSIPIYTAAVDKGLNEKAYIVPGLGDAGDRYFGTV